MGKKKTRQEKKIADLHRKITLQQAIIQPISPVEIKTRPTYTFTHQTKGTTMQQQPYEYLYVTHDLIKTTLLSLSIITFQIILYFLLRIHVLKLPGLGY